MKISTHPAVYAKKTGKKTLLSCNIDKDGKFPCRTSRRVNFVPCVLCSSVADLFLNVEVQQLEIFKRFFHVHFISFHHRLKCKPFQHQGAFIGTYTTFILISVPGALQFVKGGHKKQY